MQPIVTERDFVNAYQNREDGNIVVLEDLSSRGEQVLAVQQEGVIWYLQDSYDADRAASQWAAQLKEKVKNNTVIIVFGLADGSYVRKLLQYNQEAHIIVYEPCAEVFWQVCGRTEVAELLEEECVHLLVGGISDKGSSSLGALINYANFRLVEMCVLPNYDRLFVKSSRNMLVQRLFIAKQIVFSRNTERVYGREFIHNILSSSKDVIEQYSIVQLMDIVPKKNLSKMPAVLVSAGP